MCGEKGNCLGAYLGGDGFFWDLFCSEHGAETKTGRGGIKYFFGSFPFLGSFSSSCDSTFSGCCLSFCSLLCITHEKRKGKQNTYKPEKRKKQEGEKKATLFNMLRKFVLQSTCLLNQTNSHTTEKGKQKRDGYDIYPNLVGRQSSFC